MIAADYDFLLVRTRGPGFGIWLFPVVAYGQRQLPWWRRRWLRFGPMAVAFFWGMP